MKVIYASEVEKLAMLWEKAGAESDDDSISKLDAADNLRTLLASAVELPEPGDKLCRVLERLKTAAISWQLSAGDNNEMRECAAAIEAEIDIGLRDYSVFSLPAPDDKLRGAVRLAIEWRGLDGDGISEPTLGILRAALRGEGV